MNKLLLLVTLVLTILHLINFGQDNNNNENQIIQIKVQQFIYVKITCSQVFNRYLFKILK